MCICDPKGTAKERLSLYFFWERRSALRLLSCFASADVKVRHAPGMMTVARLGRTGKRGRWRSEARGGRKRWKLGVVAYSVQLNRERNLKRFCNPLCCIQPSPSIFSSTSSTGCNVSASAVRCLSPLPQLLLSSLCPSHSESSDKVHMILQNQNSFQLIQLFIT
jgi:hypothetical protein